MSRKSVLLAGTAKSEFYRAGLLRCWWLSIDRYLGIEDTHVMIKLGRYAAMALADTIDNIT